MENTEGSYQTRNRKVENTTESYQTRKRKRQSTEESSQHNNNNKDESTKVSRVEEDDDLFRCKMCRHVFSNNLNLRRHMAAVSNTGQYHCSICNLRYNELKRYETHKKNTHGPTNNFHFRCDFCKESFKSKAFLKAHVVHYHLQKPSEQPEQEPTEEPISKRLRMERLKPDEVKEEEPPEKSNLKPTVCLKNIIPTSLKISFNSSSGPSSGPSPSSGPRKSTPPKQRQSKLTDFLIRKPPSQPVQAPGPRSMKRAAFKRSEENLRNLNYFTSVKTYDKKYDSYLAECYDCKPCSVLLKRVELDQSPQQIGNTFYYKGVAYRNPNLVLERLDDYLVSSALDDFITSNLEVPSTSSSVFTCKVCGQELDTAERLEVHVWKHHTIYASSVCSARFTSIKKLTSHFATKHRIQGSYECSICGENPGNYDNLRKHYKIHCIPIDDVDVVDRETVDLHSDCQQKNRALNCVCGSCQPTKSSLKSHQKSCKEWLRIRSAARKSVGVPPPVPERREILQLPATILKPAVKLEQVSPKKPVLVPAKPTPPSSPEVIAEFESPAEVVVDEMPTEFVAVEDYTETESVTESPTPETQSFQYVGANEPVAPSNDYPCTVCETHFKTLANFQRHQKIYNTGKQEACKFCNSLFPSKQQLNNHISLTHVQFKALSYHCPVCNQGFSKKTPYRMHLKHIHATDHPENVDTIFVTETDPFDNLRCEICKMEFDNREEMKDHKKFYDPSVILGCASCEMEFQGDFALTQHNKMIHPVQTTYYTYNCTICGEGFVNDNELNSHMLHVHAWASSDMCNQQMSIDEAHSFSDMAAGVYVCVTCKMTFLDFEGLRLHRDEFIDDGDNQCHVCYKRFRNMPLLESHLQLTHMPVTNMVTFKCQICGEVYLSAIALGCHEKHFHPDLLNQPEQVGMNQWNGEHVELNQEELDQNQTELNQVNGNPEEPNQVSRIPAFTTSVSTIINTMARPEVAQAPKKALRCPSCKLSFADKVSLEYHKREYENKGDFECNVCKRKFELAQHLQAHKEKHNETVQYSLRCNVCSEGFSASSFLFMHVGHLHGIEELRKVLQRMTSKKDTRPAQKNFSIELDDKTIHEVRISVNKNLLDSKFLKQIIVEAFTDFSAEFPQTSCSYDFQCRVCKLVFSSQGNLNKHLIRYLKEGEYPCKLCDKKFRWVANVEDHRRKHFNITCTNVFTCPICFERFVTNISLYAHKAHFHDRALYANRQQFIMADDQMYPVQDVPELNNGTRGIGQVVGQGPSGIGPDKQFTCRICYEKFGNESKLMSHVVARHSEQAESDQSPLALCETSLNNYFLCSGCQTVFESSQDLESHEKNCSKFKCKDCDRIFKTDMQLKSHKETVHRPRQDDEPKIQPKEVASKVAVSPSRVGKLKVKSFAKLVDDGKDSSTDSSRDSVISYAQKSILKKVLEKKPVEQVEPLQPIHVSNNALNGKRLIVTWDNIYKLVKSTPNSYVDDLKSRIHPSGISVAFECKICRLLFLDERSLAAHMIRECWENRCFVCCRTFENSCTVLRHIETHQDIVCQVCGGVFLDSLSFNYHVSQCIEQVKSDCFKVSEEMHLTRTHLKELKEIICGLCRDTFKNIENATVHLKLTHCVYKCGICQAKFYGKNILQQHMRSNHCNAPQFGVRFCDRCNTGHANFEGFSKHVCVPPS